MESIKRQAKAVKASGCLVADTNSLPSQAVADYEGRIEKLQDEKQRLYESFVIGDISRDEYIAKKSNADAELERVRQILEAILSQTKTETPDAEAIDIAKKALRKRILSKVYLSSEK